VAQRGGLVFVPVFQGLPALNLQFADFCLEFGFGYLDLAFGPVFMDVRFILDALGFSDEGDKSSLLCRGLPVREETRRLFPQFLHGQLVRC